jgi:hypothetical protein
LSRLIEGDLDTIADYIAQDNDLGFFHHITL